MTRIVLLLALTLVPAFAHAASEPALKVNSDMAHPRYAKTKKEKKPKGEKKGKGGKGGAFTKCDDLATKPACEAHAKDHSCSWDPNTGFCGEGPPM